MASNEGSAMDLLPNFAHAGSGMTCSKRQALPLHLRCVACAYLHNVHAGLLCTMKHQLPHPAAVQLVQEGWRA
jgi:hypothetical protein